MDYIFKVIAIGDPGVGKNTLFQKHSKLLVPFDKDKPIGVEFYQKKNNEKWEFQIWNFNTEERFRFLLPSYCKGASGAFFVFDITNTTTFKNVYEWFNLLNMDRKFIGSMMLIGNKIDLEYKRDVEIEQAKEACRKLGFSRYIESSFLTGINVEEIFEKMAEDIILEISLS